MRHIDIAMTAVLRPKILRGTLQTIVDRVVDHPDRYRLIINIDPIGVDVEPSAVVDVCKEFFGEVVHRAAPAPSFPAAVRWVWSKTSAPYVFHWEDDVEILRQIDVRKMMDILDNNARLASLRLFSKATPYKGNRMHVFQSYWDYKEEGFWLARDWRAQFGLNPTLIKRKFVKEAVTRMVDHVNPEKQFRVSQAYMRPLISKWRFGIYAGKGEKRIIDGRKGQRWKDKLKIDKPGGGQTFLKWVKKY
jgi:hypothetical protein